MKRRLAGVAISTGAVVAAGVFAPMRVTESAAATPNITIHTPAEVNAAVAKAIAYLDTQQHPDGSFGVGGSSLAVAETALALISYGVYDHGDVNSGVLTAAEVTIVTKAVTWLLSQQDTSTGTTKGSWAPSTFYKNYSTGLALAALSFSKNGAAAAAMQTAITNGRSASIAMFQGPSHTPPETCTTAPADPTSHWCGGFNYDYGGQQADESNTGFGLTGLKLTGGLSDAMKTLNAGWQHNIQVLTSNAYWTGQGRNDGGGAYRPGETYQPFVSNANDTGSMLFGYGYDGVPAADPGVVAGLKFGQDVLDTYELNTSNRAGVFHTGTTENGSCVIGSLGCTWQFNSDGGYHYSLWALSKGLGEYISPNLGDGTNWYAKVADLLLTQQQANGSWPVNGRDDATVIVSTGFSVFAIGLAAVPPPPVVTFNASSFHIGTTCSAAHLTWSIPNSPNYGGLLIRRRTDQFPTSTTDGTLVASVKSPGTTFDDTGLATGATYYYGAFPYDVTGQVFGPEATATASTAVCAEVLPTVVLPTMLAPTGAGSTVSPVGGSDNGAAGAIGVLAALVVLLGGGAAIRRRVRRGR